MLCNCILRPCMHVDTCTHTISDWYFRANSAILTAANLHVQQCIVYSMNESSRGCNSDTRSAKRPHQAHFLSRQLSHTMLISNVTHAFAGAQAVASDSTNAYSGGAATFASATARFTIVRQCLFNATIAANAAASTAVSTAETAISSSNATSATSVITKNICNPVTATAVAQAFAEAIATGTGCNGVVYTAITCEPLPCHAMHGSCPALLMRLVSHALHTLHLQCRCMTAVDVQLLSTSIFSPVPPALVKHPVAC